MSDILRRIIRELIEEELELDETTSSGAAGPYNTPFAFRGNAASGKEKAKKNSTVATGYELVNKTQETADEAGPQDNDPVSFGEKGKGGLKAPKKEKVIQESKYDEFKMAEGSSRKKIGEAIHHISRQISEVDKMLRMAERLKLEDNNGPNGQLWKSTAKALTKLEGRMNTMSTRIRNLKA